MSSPSNAAKPITQRTHRLFAKFRVYYGHVWKSLFVDEKFFVFAKEEWQAVLEQFDDVVLNQAIISCLDTHEMPPTLPQFLKICRHCNKRQEDMHPKIEEEIKRTPKDVARAHLQNILNQLPKK